MKVIHLSAEKTWRGGEQQIAYLLEELNSLGIDQLVVCRKNSSFEKYCIEQKINHKSLRFKNQFDVSSSLHLSKIAKEYQADIIHIHSSHAHAIAVWSYYLGNKTNMVLSRKVDFPISKNVLSKIKYNCPGIKKIICVSNAIKEIMQRDILEKDKCITVYDGIDLNKFNTSKKDKLRLEYQLSNDTKIIASTAALADHKDYPTFISAVKHIQHKLKAKYFIIGDGPMKEEIVELVKEHQLENDIIFTGFRTDVQEILPGVDVFVLSSKTEGLGSSILDAFACKVAVACTNAGGIKEIVENEKTGLISEVGDAVQLAKNIQRLCDDEALRTELINNAFLNVQHFDKKKMAEQTLEVYKQIIFS